MISRNFVRAFAIETGMTPAKAVERLRLEAARERVENGAQPIECIAWDTGFGDPGRMRRTFLRAFGQPPQALCTVLRELEQMMLWVGKFFPLATDVADKDCVMCCMLRPCRSRTFAQRPSRTSRGL
jgi:AraC-like DNA-binding protein